MIFRRAQLGDYEQIVELQNKNLSRSALATAYTALHFKQMNTEMCVVVCEDQQKICGYLGSCNINFFRQFPIAAAMLKRLTKINYHGSPLDLSRVLVTNPVCIDEAYRGRDIYIQLCKTLFPYLPTQYDLAVTLVAVENQRSFIATSRLGFETVEQFTIDGKEFHTMIISLSEFSRLFMLNMDQNGNFTASCTER